MSSLMVDFVTPDGVIERSVRLDNFFINSTEKYDLVFEVLAVIDRIDGKSVKWVNSVSKVDQPHPFLLSAELSCKDCLKRVIRISFHDCQSPFKSDNFALEYVKNHLFESEDSPITGFDISNDLLSDLTEEESGIADTVVEMIESNGTGAARKEPLTMEEIADLLNIDPFWLDLAINADYSTVDLLNLVRKVEAKHGIIS